MFPRKNFNGKIGENTIYDIVANLDYSLSFEERMKIVEERLLKQDGSPNEFFENVFTQEFDEKINTNISNVKLILTCNDILYSETNVAKSIEKLANYLIVQYEKEHGRDAKTSYKIISDKKLKELEGRNEDIFSQVNENELVFVKDESINYKKTIEQKIFKSDLDDSYCGGVLKDYEVFIDYCRTVLSTFSRLKNIYIKTDGFKYFDVCENDEKLKKDVKELDHLISEEIVVALGKLAYKCRCVVGELIKDQIMAKDKIKGTIYFKQVMGDSTEIDYDQFDFTNKDHVKELLRVHCGEDFNEDLSCLVYDLENLIKKCEFSESETKVLKLWRNTGYTQEQIAKMLGTSQPNVKQTLDRVINTIIKIYEDQYNDWYYLEVEKGEYKTCGVCGQVKLVSEFSPKKDSKDGLHPYCKECRKK